MDSQVEDTTTSMNIGGKYSVDVLGEVPPRKIEFEIEGEKNVPPKFTNMDSQYKIKITDSYEGANWMLKVHDPGSARAGYRPYLRVENGRLNINGIMVDNFKKISQGGGRKNKVFKQRLRKSKVRKSKRTKKRTRKRKSKKYSRKTRRSFIKKSRKNNRKLKGGAHASKLS